MEYSTDDIAAARSLQFATTYDYACSIHEEWTYLLRSHWSKMKGLYIVTRYLPFIILAMYLYMSLTPNENSSKCGVLQNINTGLRMVIAMFSEWFFILRTHVLWDKNRILLAAMLSGLLDWRTNTSHLYVVLVNHNISYYACGFRESTSTRRPYFNVRHLICKSHGVMPYPVSYSVPFMEQICGGGGTRKWDVPGSSGVALVGDVGMLASAHTPCCCILGVRYEAELDFCHFEFSTFLVLPSDIIIQRLSRVWR
ncbi:hypothetical protein EV424DRAFT_1344981 [Suillus variegatus]|nr:hypothetical protein EV424DRAFT_1344981 [Suillus variegatus]